MYATKLKMTSESTSSFKEADSKPYLYNEVNNDVQNVVLSWKQPNSNHVLTRYSGFYLPDPPMEIEEQNIKIKHLRSSQNRVFKRNFKCIEEATAALKNIRSNKWRVSLATKINKVRIKKKVKETTKLVEELEALSNERKRMTTVLLELPRKIAADKVRQYLLMFFFSYLKGF